jgi:hypothetical protein
MISNCLKVGNVYTGIKSSLLNVSFQGLCLFIYNKVLNVRYQLIDREFSPKKKMVAPMVSYHLAI